MFKYQIVNVLGFTPSTIDTNMYYQRNTKKDGTDYYELLLFYVDRILECSHDAKSVKNDEITETKRYVGVNAENF